MKTGLYIGRFQPFHLGHLSAIKQALKQVDRLFIAIGSSQYSGEANNPYSADERQKMIELSLDEAGIRDLCEIFKVPDIHDNEKWTKHLRSILPPFNLVFVGSEGIVKELFEKDETPVSIVKKEIDISATEIREAMASNKGYQKYLSKSVLAFLTLIHQSQTNP